VDLIPYDDTAVELGGPVGHFDPQGIEFRCESGEASISRGAMLRRMAAAGVGLARFSNPAAAWAGQSGTARAITGGVISFAELVKRAKKEGKLNVIGLPHDNANYGEIIGLFKKRYGIAVAEVSPNASSAEENQAIRSLKGDSRAPDVVDVGPAFAVPGAKEGLYAPYRVRTYKSILRSMKDPSARWYGDYWGAISIGYNADIVKPAPEKLVDLFDATYKNMVAMNGSPLTSGSGVAGVFAAALASGGSVGDVEPGIDFFRRLKQAGNFITVSATPQTVAAGETPIVIDWDYVNLALGKEFPAANWRTVIPSDGVYGAFYCQAVSKTAPHPYAARLWEEFLYSDRVQLLFLKGYSHPARFQDLAKRKKIPPTLISALPPATLYAKVKFASDSQQAAAKARIAAEWPTI
jgi:putative spermidine/putrescine transport system substrate-binding protein